MSRTARSLVAVVISAAAAALAVAVLGREEAPPPSSTRPLPAPPQPAFAIPRPARLALEPTAAHWAAVATATQVRATPSLRAPATTRLDTRTPEGTANLVLVLGQAEDASGRLWIRVRTPGLPGETTGWVRRAALGGYHAVRTRLVIDVDGQAVLLLRDGRPILRAPAGVGRPGWPTPRGEFYVRSRLTRFRSPFYGPVAFGTSARAGASTDWPDGGFVGIHGTNRPDLLPGRVSHGCIRLRNADILRLERLMPVGTPVSIR
jgi:lipoprotein-anchoring transpeptidase ErfK/SrfK